LLDAPVEIFGIEDKAEEEGFAGDRENMKKSAALMVGVVQTDFFNRVEAAVPNKPSGINSAFATIESEGDRDWFWLMEGHVHN